MELDSLQKELDLVHHNACIIYHCWRGCGRCDTGEKEWCNRKHWRINVERDKNVDDGECENIYDNGDLVPDDDVNHLLPVFKHHNNDPFNDVDNVSINDASINDCSINDTSQLWRCR